MGKTFEALCRLLQGRDHSERELRTKLFRRFSPCDIDKALNEARQRGLLLEPQKLSENFARIWHRRHKGHAYIQNQLKQKGLPLVDKDADLELQKARHIAQKLHEADKARLSRRLMTRGFEYDTIKQVVDDKLYDKF